MQEKIKRFWKKVQKAGPNDCWLWKGCKNSRGYGLFTWHKPAQLAHRVSYEIEYGTIDNKLLCCHTCDNPLCVNPKHLFLGTARENLADCVRKNRSINGAKNHNCKLNKLIVKKIREEHFGKLKLPINKLAEKYNVSPSTIWAVIKNITWSTGITREKLRQRRNQQ